MKNLDKNSRWVVAQLLKFLHINHVTQSCNREQCWLAENREVSQSIEDVLKFLLTQSRGNVVDTGGF